MKQVCYNYLFFGIHLYNFSNNFIIQFNFHLVPVAAPTNITLQTIRPQSIRVTICPPPQIDQNGLILRYNVSYTGNPFDTSTQFVTVNVSIPYPATTCTNTNLTGLEDFNNYTVTVRAVNAIGSSDPSIGVIAQTNAAGSYCQFTYISILEHIINHRLAQMTKW